MGRELPIRIDEEVAVEPGLSPALDEAAAAADPRHALLRRAWYAAAAGSDAVTVVARRGGATVAALPLVKAGPLGLRAVPGSYWPFRSFPIVAEAKDADLSALLRVPAARAALGRFCRVGPLPADDPTITRLRRVAPGCGYALLTRRAGMEYGLDVTGATERGGWPRASTQRNMNKHRKRLARLGEVEFRYLTGSAWTPALFDALAEIERHSWQAEGDAKFLDPGRRRGWEIAAADPVLAAMLSVGLLSIAGQPVAFSFGLNCGRIRYCVATSYDARFAKHSPGYLAGYLTYIEAAAAGVDCFNLGAGDGGEKRSMGAVPMSPLVDCLLVRGKLPGAAVAPLWRVSGKAGA